MKLRHVILLLVLAGSCKPNYDAPCRASYSDHENIGSTHLGLWPFNSVDTLRYFASNGDSLFLYSDSSSYNYLCFGKENNPECPHDSICHQFITLNYLKASSALVYTASTHSYDQTVRIHIPPQTFSFSFSELGSSDSAAIDSVNWNGSPFYHIYTRAGNAGDSLYYTTKEGVIRYTFPTQHYTLKP